MHIPDFTRTSSTDPHLPPHCASVSVRRKAPGASFLWTLTLVWPLDEEIVESDITLPSPFARDADDIEQAYNGDGPAYLRAVEFAQVCTATVSTRVSSTAQLPAIEKADAKVRKIEIRMARLYPPAPRVLTSMWCGHSWSCVMTDDNGVTYCGCCR